MLLNTPCQTLYENDDIKIVLMQKTKVPATKDLSPEQYETIRQYAREHNGINISQIQRILLIGYNSAYNALTSLITDGFLESSPNANGKYKLHN